MPFMKCPVCGLVTHIKPVSPKSWPHTHPGPAAGLGLCYLCWGSLSVGQTVKVWRVLEKTRATSAQVEVGDVGRIVEIRTSTLDGADDEYLVKQMSDVPKWTAVLSRMELHRVDERSSIRL